MSIDSNFCVWEGVYRSFDEAPVLGFGFDGPLWRDRSIAAARETLAFAQVNRLCAATAQCRDAAADRNAFD